MAQAIELTGAEHPKVIAALKKAGRKLAVGDTFVSRRYDTIMRITSFFVSEEYANEDYHAGLRYREWDWKQGRWSEHEGQKRIVEWAHSNDYFRTDEDPEEFTTRTLADWGAIVAAEARDQGTADRETKTIVATSNAEKAITLERALAARKRRIELARVMIDRQVTWANNLTHALEQQLTYLRKVIEIGNLYLGINETVTVLREGERAPAGTPVTIMQSILYMDEEVGIERGYDDGYEDDYATVTGVSVEKFDDWITEGDHLARILPAQKGIVALRPTQRPSNGGNAALDIARAAEDAKIYLLVRNGEALWRLRPALVVGKLLYPLLGEWAQLMDAEARGITYTGSTRTEDRVFDYRKVMALLQGLFDRTDILQPLPPGLNIFQPDTYADAGHLDFVRDAEPSLTTGRPSYSAWRVAGAQEIVAGSRVLIGPWPYQGSSRDDSDWYGRKHFLVYQHNYPRPPKPGIYAAHDVPADRPKRKGRGEHRIFYNPGDSVETYDRRNGWQVHDRQKGYSFCIDADDTAVLNYDSLTVEDIDWYINDRRERRGYLEMLPVLFRARTMLLEEQQRELAFATLVATELGKSVEEVLNAVAWWKTRNKWKRGLGDDDKRAWRMIRRTLTTGAWRKGEA